MTKTCLHCSESFTTKDSRQKTCSRSCAIKYRTANLASKQDDSANHKFVQPSIVKVDRASLPPPEELPAPYAKRVHDMWAALTGESPVRIA